MPTPRLRWFVAALIAAATLVPSTSAQETRYQYFGGFDYDPSIPTPREHFGYDIGDHFTRYGDMVGYLKTLDEVSDRIVMERYGASHQRRDLYLLTISSPENLGRLDTILDRNRALTDQGTSDAEVARIVSDNPAIVWFSYNVHGNEPSTTECAIQLAYTLAAARNAEVERLLDEVVVAIDPLLNPDGRQRYVTWFQDQLGQQPLTNPNVTEHDEPWPTGRTNHYHFDLNRDWLWLTQPESQARMEIYGRYMPHLHIDFHEQHFRHPYFLGAGDEPYHVHIPPETKAWVERYGQANATVFDQRGLVYSTAERFDYLYPGYGKVMPVYYGAVGMLAEKAGHGRAGLAIDAGTHTLTLAERTDHHFLLSMNNLETTMELRREQLERFRAYFDNNALPDEVGIHAFFLPADNDPALLERVWDLCSAHGIEIHRLTADTRVSHLHDYRDGTTQETRELPAGTWVVPVDQQMGRLATTIFERHTEVVDRDTYDITAWSLPIALGMRAAWTTAPLNASTTRIGSWSPPVAKITGSGDVASIVDAAQHRFPLAIALAGTYDISARIAAEPFTVDGQSFAAGSLIIHTIDNQPAAVEAFLRSLQRAGLDGHRADSGLTEDGPVLGANANRRFIAPRPILLRGRPTSANSYGQIWHLLDVESPQPYAPINITRMGGVDLDEYNVVIVPSLSGDLTDELGESNVSDLNAWIRDGGTLIAIGGASQWASRKILGLKNDTPPEDRPRIALNRLTWEERRFRRVEDRVPGTLLSASIDTTHPLGQGVPDWMGVIKRGTRMLPVRDDTYVVARFEDEPRISGVISERNASRVAGTPLITHHRHGRGQVICFSEDFAFRGFQHGPMRLLLNAIAYGPTLAE